MPLRDHFEPAFAEEWPWASVHGQWIHMIAGQLNQSVLPRTYRALPEVHVGTQLEIDVATSRVREQEGEEAGNGVATKVWAPAQVQFAAEVDFTDRDTFEIQVRETTRRRLVAALEMVSPANKDRPSTRRDFVVKCASYLQHRVSVIILDVIAERQHNLHRELMQFLELPAELIEAVSSPLYAVSYRIRLRDDDRRQLLELWPHVLQLNADLPTLPLWLAEDLAVPLNLEASYRVACEMLGIE